MLFQVLNVCSDEIMEKEVVIDSRGDRDPFGKL